MNKKYNVVLYKDGKYHSNVSFGRSSKVSFSRGHAYKLASDVRKDEKFSKFSVYVESSGV